MSSSLSPEHYAGSGGSQGSPDPQDKTMLSNLNLNFLKNLSDKKVTREGNPPKRRGPKPDSKPALTRRQELNRQAQRTHRERKETYIKSLEGELLRMREIYTSMSQDKDKLADENKHLKQLLVQSGIQYSRLGMADDLTSHPSIGQASTTTSYVQGSQGAFSPTSQSTAMSTSPPSHQSTMGLQMRNTTPQPPGARGIDYEQAGIDFVLTLEKPCMSHMPFLMDRASEPNGEACGHALMASCPPSRFDELTPDVPFGNMHTHMHMHDPTNPELPQGTWELSKADLSTLMDLSKKLDLDGEITPVMAWGIIMVHPRLSEAVPGDFEKLAEDLTRKVRCFGFGAVLEEFELRDAFEHVLSCRSDGMVY